MLKYKRARNIDMREQVIKEILERKIIAIVRGATEDEAVRAAEALYKGGVS